MYLPPAAADGEAEDQAAYAADDMGQLGDGVAAEQTVQEFAAQIEDHHQNEGDGDALFAHLRKGGQDDHHKDDAAGTEERSGGEEHELHKAGNQRRQGDAEEGGTVTVFLLHAGANQQQEQHIVHIVAIVGVTQHVGKHTQIGQRIAEGGAVDAEIAPGGVAVCPVAKHQCDQAQQGEGQQNGCIKADDDSSHGEYLFSNSLCHSILHLTKFVNGGEAK